MTMKPSETAASPVDFDHLMIMTDGDREFAAELIQMFRIDTRQRLETLEKALATQDWPRVEREAHTIKGASSNMGTGRVRELAYELEKLGREAGAGNSAGILAELTREFDRADLALSAWLEGI
jgi:HPt (histidine-containing phosphotransfer) domain-containing protein